MHEFTIDRERYGLPAGPDDPVYTAVMWPLSKATVHFKEACIAFGPQVADLFAASGAGEDSLARIAASGYPGALVLELGNFDIVGSFKRMSGDGQLRRVGREGTCDVYHATKGEAFSQTDMVNGLEYYYAGKIDVVYRLWWALLCENTAPFAALHGWIAKVLQRLKPAPSPQP